LRAADLFHNFCAAHSDSLAVFFRLILVLASSQKKRTSQEIQMEQPSQSTLTNWQSQWGQNVYITVAAIQSLVESEKPKVLLTNNYFPLKVSSESAIRLS
jgi:hypothetical protein